MARFTLLTVVVLIGHGVFGNTVGRVFPVNEKLRFAELSAGARWSILDWRGNERQSGRIGEDGLVAPAALPPGYWTLLVDGRTNLTFTTVVAPESRRQVVESAYAADSALSWVAADPVNFRKDVSNRVAHVIDLMRLTGITQTRERFSWNDVQPKREDPIDWGAYLRNAKRMKAAGIRFSWVNGQAPGWAGGKDGGWGRVALAKDLVALHDFCRKVAETFGPYCADFEYLNEPDLTFPAWDAAAQAKAAACGFRAAKSGVPVTGPSLCLGVDFNYDNLFYANGVFPYLDLFNIHSYLPLADYEKFQTRTHRFLEKQGVGDMPILVTECGCDTEGVATMPTDHPKRAAHTPEQEMQIADFLPKSQILRQFGGVWRNHFFVFGSFHERNGRKDWGILRRDGSAKPALAAFSTLIAELDGARCLGEIAAPAGTRAFIYEQDDGQKTLAFWGKAGTRLRVPGKDTARLTDWCGTPTEVASRDGVIEVEAGRHVAYLSGNITAAVVKPAMPAGRPRLREFPSGLDPEVIIRVDFPKAGFAVMDGGTAVELKSGRDDLRVVRADMFGSTGKVKVEVWNLSDRMKRGRVEISGGELAGWPETVELPARGVFAREVTLRPAVGKNGEARLKLVGEFEGLRTSPFEVPVRDPAVMLASCVKVTPDWANPENWERNNSAVESRIWNDGGVLRMDASWVGSKQLLSNYDKWCYNRLKVPAEIGRRARYVEFEIRSEQDKVENNFACANVFAVYRGHGEERIVCRGPMLKWEKRRVALPSNRRDSDLLTLGIGANPAGMTVSFFIRNVVIYCEE